ncbi:MAG: phosphate acetyltransferase [Saprospiraceae bacterium]
MDLFKSLEAKAKRLKKTVILPESYDERVIRATQIILDKNIANIILIRKEKPIKIKSCKNLAIIDINFSSQFAYNYFELRKIKSTEITFRDTIKELYDPMTFASMLLKNKFADAIVSGSNYSTSDVLRNGMRIIGLKKNNKTVSSFFLFTFPKRHKLKNKVFAYADCGVVPNPTAEQLSYIAIQTSENYKKLTGNTPRTAFLSFSTKGSAISESTEKVIEALNITKRKLPKLICDGELQFDAAFVPQVAKRKNPKSEIKGDANVFIFPDLDSGNIAYKITERIGGGIATGPIVQGLKKPVMDLSRGCSVQDIVNMVTIACLS